MNKKIKVGELDITVKYRKGMKKIYLRVEKNSDIEIITDPKWIKIALHAKKIICLWDKKYGSR